MVVRSLLASGTDALRCGSRLQEHVESTLARGDAAGYG